MRARDIMTATVIGIEPDATVEKAVGLMLDKRVSGLPVIHRDGRIVGILTEGDLLRRAELGTERKRPRWLEFIISPGRLAEEYVHTRGRKVEEVMTRDVVTVSEDAPIEAVVELMDRHRIKRIPVTRDGAPVGVVSRADLLAALVDKLRGHDTGEAREDSAILADIEAEFGRMRFLPGSVAASVTRGEVQLTGTIMDERERDAIRVAVENIRGVRTVRDELTWADPVPGTFPM